jgi:hypothetical protein
MFSAAIPCCLNKGSEGWGWGRVGIFVLVWRFLFVMACYMMEVLNIEFTFIQVI